MTPRSLKLRGLEIPFTEVDISVDKLAFYPKNPRLYSWIVASPDAPDQVAIQEKLGGMDHVKKLREQIAKDGQVNDPLYCMAIPTDDPLREQYEYQVLEGNRRLAALKMGTPESPPLYDEVRCYILDFSEYDDQTRESLIFSLLGHFHITAKQKWESYETAAYIFHRHIMQEISIDELAREIELPKSKIRHIVEAYQMMRKFKDPKASHWSYFLAYISSAKIKNFRSMPEHKGLDKRVAGLIKSGTLPRATTFRDALPLILDMKAARETLYDETNPASFVEAEAMVEDIGRGNKLLQMLRNTRIRLDSPATKSGVAELLSSTEMQQQATEELTAIRQTVEAMLRKDFSNE